MCDTTSSDSFGKEPDKSWYSGCLGNSFQKHMETRFQKVQMQVHLNKGIQLNL